MFTFDPLWKILINKGLTKTQLREMTGISTATLSKLSKDEYISMQVLDKICEFLNVDSVSQVVEFVSDKVEVINIGVLKGAILLAKDTRDGYDEGTKNTLYRYIYKLFIENIEFANSNDDDKLKTEIGKLLRECHSEDILSKDDMLKLSLMLV